MDIENNKNIIQKSDCLKLPKDLFIDITNETFNNIKCKYCEYIPLMPIVIKNDNLEQGSDYEIFCKDCYNKLSLNKKYININNIDKQYSSLIKTVSQNTKIKCINQNLGCDWKNELSKLEFHLNECLYEAIKCPNKECNQKILKKNLNSHLIECEYTNIIIKAKCNYCKKDFNIQNISEHLKKCPELIVDCEKGCGKKIKIKNLEEHKNNNCLEELEKCAYWNKGCKKFIKRKYLADHYILEKNNHLNLEPLIEIKDNFNLNLDIDNKESFKEKKTKENSSSSNNLKLNPKIKEKGKEKEKEKEKDREEIKNYSYENNIKKQEIINNNNNVDNKNKNNNQEEIKNYNNYDNYIPFTGNIIKFITQEENIKKNIIIFEREKIKYSGNFYNNLNIEKYYITFSQDIFDLKKVINFQFRLYSPYDEKTNQKLPLPIVAFGLYKSKKNSNINVNNIVFPDENFYCIDLNSNSYKLGKICINKEADKINTNGYITISFYPNSNNLLFIKDNYDLEIKMNLDIPQNLHNNYELRLCFIFKGKERAIVDYNY